MNNENIKKQIQYSRTYRYIKFNKINMFLGIFLCILPLCLLVVFYYTEITLFISRIAMHVLNPLFMENVLSIETAEFIIWLGPVHYLSLPGKFPSIGFIWLNLFVTLVSLFLLSTVVKTRPLTIFLSISLWVHVCSAVFFTFFSEYFPYDATEYSGLYIKQQVGIYFFIPIIIGVALIMLPVNFFKAWLTIAFCALYSFIFGIVRYITFMFILSKISIIYMASLFFSFGPFIDFLYLVCIYSLVASNTAVELKRNKGVWRW